MKKNSKALFLFCIMACPFFFTACEKDHGTTRYEDVDDDDWKKKAIESIEFDGYESQDITGNV